MEYHKTLLEKSLEKEYNQEVKIGTADDIYREMTDLKNEHKEVFVVFHLNTKNKIILREIVAIGTLNASLIHPRETFRTAIINNANSMKIKNPDIQGEEYQNGVLKNFWNVREYVLHRDNHTCQYCKGKSGDKILQVHHIHGKKEGATNRPEELLTVCKTCHDKHHNGINIIPDKEIHRFKPETFMTVVRWKLVNQLKEMYGDVHHTYGYITKTNRISMHIPKSHVNDAFVITGGTSQERCEPYIAKQVRRNNRSIQTNRKGFKPSIRRQRYSFQPNDLVRYDKKICRVKGVFSYGKWIRIVDSIGNIINSNIKNVELICYGKGIFG